MKREYEYVCPVEGCDQEFDTDRVRCFGWAEMANGLVIEDRSHSSAKPIPKEES